MNNKTLSIVAGFIVIIITAYFFRSLTKPCNGSYKFNLKEGEFVCIQEPVVPPQPVPSSPLPPKQATPTALINHPQGQTKPVLGKPHNIRPPKEDVFLKRCSALRASDTTRRAINSDAVADAQCRNIVKGVPENYTTLPNKYRLQADGSITFNSGQRYNGIEIWCNCHPEPSLETPQQVSGELGYQAKFDKDKTNELSLARDGEEAFGNGDYEWAIRFLQNAKKMQTSGVWQSSYPFLYGAQLAYGNRSDAAATRADMIAAVKVAVNTGHGYLSRQTTIGFMLSNLGAVRKNLADNYKPDIDSLIDTIAGYKEKAEQ